MSILSCRLGKLLTICSRGDALGWLQELKGFEDLADNIMDRWETSVNNIMGRIFTGNTSSDLVVGGKSNFSALFNALDNGLFVKAPIVQYQAMIEGALVSHMIPVALLQSSKARPFIMYVVQR